MSSASAGVLLFLVGLGLGLFVGWRSGRPPAAPVPADDTPPIRGRAGAAVTSFFRTAALLVLVVVVFATMAVSLAHTKPHR